MPDTESPAERVPRIGDIVLYAGDTLLVEAHPSFADQQRNSRDFFLVSRVEGSNPPRHGARSDGMSTEIISASCPVTRPPRRHPRPLPGAGGA